MTITPWGPARELRSRKLSPGPGTPRSAVAQNQRERLYGATVAMLAQRGYDETRVADILELAGVSRSAFYKHFANKRECVLATVEAIAGIASTRIVEAYQQNRPWDERLGAALDALIEHIVEQPAAARVWFVEVYAAGPDVVARMEAVREVFEQLAWNAIRESPERGDMPFDLVRAGLGGLRKVVLTRIRHGRERELLALAPDLLDWALSYRPPPERIKRPRRRPRAPALPAYDPNDTRERILEAVTILIADQGYAATSISDIARQAAISFSTFYAHFAGKDEAFVGALERARWLMGQAVIPAYQGAPNWPEAVAAGMRALFAFLATDTAVARLAGFEALASEREALDFRDDLLTDLGKMLADGYRVYPTVSPIAADAIGASITALVYDHLRRNGTDRLYELTPMAAFIALAPFLGTEQACAIANENCGGAIPELPSALGRA